MARVTTDREGISRSVEQEFVAKKLAVLVKLFDMRDAWRLLFLYHRFPEDISCDLEMIEAAFHAGHTDSINDLFTWYNGRNMDQLAGVSEDSMQPKSELRISQWWAETELRAVARAVQKKEEWHPMRDDIPF